MNKIIILVPYYLPGFKAGGPTRSIANLSACIGKTCCMIIITSCRDFGEKNNYKNIKPDNFYQVENAIVYYASSPIRSLSILLNLIINNRIESVYINSMYHIWSSIVPQLLLRLLRKLANKGPKRIIIAPRGELSHGALSIKRTKKRIYLWLWKKLNIGEGTIFHSTSKAETSEIKKLIENKQNKKIREIENLGTTYKNTRDISHNNMDHVKLLSICRISKMKNIDFGIRALMYSNCCIEWSIYGPIEDCEYWKECIAMANKLSNNIKFQYMGSIRPEEIELVAKEHDLFFLPSKGENFGHSISEALSLGLPVLISDRTPWTFVNDKKAGWALSLDKHEEFGKIIDNYCQMTNEEKQVMRRNAISASEKDRSAISKKYKELLL